MKNRLKPLLLWLAFALAGICIFSSCSQILGGSDSSDASVSFSFRLKPSSSFRAAALPNDEPSESKTYRVVASLVGSVKKDIEKEMKGGEEIAFSFSNVPVGAKVKAHVMVYDETELLYAGKSEEFTVQAGENAAELILREILSLYVSAEGNQENSGTSAKSSVKTLNKAFNRISEYTEEYGLSDIDWTIHVIGKVFSTSKMQNLTAGSITVVGDGDGAILDGRKENPEEGESGTVFAIDESIEFPVTVRNLTIQNGRAKNGGGMNIRSNSTTRIENCIIQNNESKPQEIDGTMQNASGGGIYFAGKNLELVNTTIQNNSTSTWVSSETKSGKIQPVNNGGNGGGICTGSKEYSVITMYEGCVIANNTAENNAGGVNMNGGTFYMKGGEISGNTAMNNSGGFYLNHGKFCMEGGKISGNKASSYKITVTNTDGTTEEKTTGGSGGGMYINRGTFIFTGGEISANEAAAVGGGIFQNGKPEDGDDGISRIEIRGGKICANNSVGGQAGGVYVRKSNSSLFLYSGEISGNTSAAQGGGVYVDEGSFTMSGGEISKNTANTQGGGVYVNRHDATCGTFTMTGGKITENWANSSTKGGGIFNIGKLALSGKITIADNMTGDESYSTPAQVFVLKDADSATLEYKGTLLYFNFNSEKNALLTANLVDGEFSETDESIFKSAFIESLADFMNREFSVFANNGIFLYLQKKDDSGNKTYEKAISSVAELAEVSNSSSGYAQGTDPFVATESGEAGTFTFENVSLYLDSVGRFRIGFDTKSEKSKYLLMNSTSHAVSSKSDVSVGVKINVGETTTNPWKAYVKVNVQSSGTLSVLISNQYNSSATSTTVAIIDSEGNVIAVEDVDNTMAKNTNDKILKAEVSEGDYYIANFWERNSEDKLVGGAIIKQIAFAAD